MNTSILQILINLLSGILILIYNIILLIYINLLLDTAHKFHSTRDFHH